MVIMDNESEAAMMLMDLGVYEKMLDVQPQGTMDVKKLTEEELLEKINRDVAVWRAYNDKEQPAEIFEEMPEKTKDAVAAPNMTSEIPVFLEKFKDTKIGQEESASDIVAEEEEEKFYLEPVE